MPHNSGLPYAIRNPSSPRKAYIGVTSRLYKRKIGKECFDINQYIKKQVNFYLLIAIFQGTLEECFKLLWKIKVGSKPSFFIIDIIKGLSYAISKYLVYSWRKGDIESLNDIIHIIRITSAALGSSLLPRAFAKILPNTSLAKAFAKGAGVVSKGQLSKELKYILSNQNTMPVNLKRDERLSQIIGATAMAFICGELLKKANTVALEKMSARTSMLLSIFLKGLGNFGGPKVSLIAISILDLVIGEALESISLPTTASAMVVRRARKYVCR